MSGTASWTTVSVGRIGRYDHVPAQVCLEPSEFEAGVGDLKWIVSLLEQQVQATCFQKVFCTLENQDSVACLQCLIPQSIDKRLPLHWDVGGRQMCVDHPAAFAVPLSISRRPPEEQDKFDRWKETANRSFSYRKGRQNSLSHCPKLVDSICRFNLLRHGDILSNGKCFAAMFETDFLPFLFVDGKPNIEDLLDFCGDVSSDNATVGTGFATMSADDHLCQAADIQSEAPVLYVLDVLQDRQDPLNSFLRVLQKRCFAMPFLPALLLWLSRKAARLIKYVVLVIHMMFSNVFHFNVCLHRVELLLVLTHPRALMLVSPQSLGMMVLDNRGLGQAPEAKCNRLRLPLVQPSLGRRMTMAQVVKCPNQSNQLPQKAMRMSLWVKLKALTS